MAEEARDQIAEYFAAFQDQRKRLLEDQMTASYDAVKGKYDSASLRKWRKLEGHEWRSRVFVRLTKMKVTAAYSVVDDIMFQTGTLPWDIQPTPYSESAIGAPLPENVAKQRCDNMKEVIDDSFAEGKADKVFRRSFTELPMYGWSWIKGPILRRFKKLRFAWDIPDKELMGIKDFAPQDYLNHARHVSVVDEYIAPVIETPSVWWIFWDLEDQDPQKGQGIVDRRWYSEGMLRKLIDRPGYDKTQINAIIEKYGEAKKPKKGTTGGGDPWREQVPGINRVFSIGEFYGRIDAKYVEEEDVNQYKEGNEVEVVATLACIGTSVKSNDYYLIRKPIINRMPMHIRPLWMCPWEEPAHEPAGIGIAENIKDAQQMVNSMTRIFVDNKALSANVMSVRKSNALAPGQGMASFPGREFIVADNVERVSDAFMFVTIPDVGDGLLPGINLFERYADEASNLPKLLQGETARYNPKTAYEMSQLMQSANKAIGKSIKNIDDYQIEPVVEGHYWFFMATSEREEIKGDYTCKAGGFAQFGETIDKGNKAAQVLTYILSNELMLMVTKIQPVLYDFMKSRGYDPKEVLKTDAEIKQTIETVSQLQQLLNASGAAAPPEPTAPETEQATPYTQ